MQDNTLTIASPDTFAGKKITFAEVKKLLRAEHPLAKPKAITAMAEEQIALLRQGINTLQQECVAAGWKQEVTTRTLKSGVRVAQFKYTEPKETAEQKLARENETLKAEMAKLRAEIAGRLK